MQPVKKLGHLSLCLFTRASVLLVLLVTTTATVTALFVITVMLARQATSQQQRDRQTVGHVQQHAQVNHNSSVQHAQQQPT